MGRKGRDTVSIKGEKQTYPGVVFQSGGISKVQNISLRSRRFELHISTQPLDPAQERWAPKIPGFENQQEYI